MNRVFLFGNGVCRILFYFARKTTITQSYNAKERERETNKKNKV